MLEEIIIVTMFIVITILIYGFTNLIIYKTDMRLFKLLNTNYISNYDVNNKLKLNGFRGEARAKRFLADLVNKKDNFITNLIIPQSDGRFTEVDCVLITRKGIFCIEVKNWTGRVNGFETDDFWYQTFSRHKKRRPKQLKNPVLQNENHVKAIYDVIGYKHKIYNIVLFSQDISLDHIVSKHVFTRSSFAKYYNSIRRKEFTRTQANRLLFELVFYKASEKKLRELDSLFVRNVETA